MDDFELDLLSEPSTAQAVLGARPRGGIASGDFDPNLPQRAPHGSSGSTVDAAELKRRIHGGSGTWRSMASMGQAAAGWIGWIQEMFKERPRLAWGVFATWSSSIETTGVMRMFGEVVGRWKA